MTEISTSVPDRPLVSVIIPFFNVETFLAEAIESVLDQTYDRWEIILVDDGGTDRSRAIADDYCRNHPGRIRCVEHPGRVNKGLSETRNIGWRAAKGDLVSFLDGDDCWLPDKLDRQVAVFEEFPHVDLCVGASVLWHRWEGSISARPDVHAPVGAPEGRVLGPREVITGIYPLGVGRAPSMNTLVMRRNIDSKAGMFEPRFRRAFEDQAFLIKCYLVCTMYILPDVLDKYRQGRAESITEADLKTGLRHNAIIEFYTWLARYLKAQGPELRGLVALARLRRAERRRKKWRENLRNVWHRVRIRRAGK